MTSDTDFSARISEIFRTGKRFSRRHLDFKLSQKDTQKIFKIGQGIVFL